MTRLVTVNQNGQVGLKRVTDPGLYQAERHADGTVVLTPVQVVPTLTAEAAKEAFGEPTVKPTESEDDDAGTVTVEIKPDLTAAEKAAAKPAAKPATKKTTPRKR